jgi:hypothetical protein
MAAIFGLKKLLHDLPYDREKVNSFRKINDAEVLLSDPIVMPENFTKNYLIRKSKNIYEKALRQYWILIEKYI